MTFSYFARELREEPNPFLQNISKDKILLGLYDGNTLIGLIDIIKIYPEECTWTIGYLLIHPSCRNKSIGSNLINAIIDIYRTRKLRCVVQNQNTRALKFWKHNGFFVTKTITEHSDNIEDITFILEKEL